MSTELPECFDGSGDEYLTGETSAALVDTIVCFNSVRRLLLVLAFEQSGGVPAKSCCQAVNCQPESS
jgi:hypothetical protein